MSSGTSVAVRCGILKLEWCSWSEQTEEVYISAPQHISYNNLGKLFHLSKSLFLYWIVFELNKSLHVKTLE